MSLEVNKDWSHWLREDDETATTNRLGAQKAAQQPVKLGGKTAVKIDPTTEDPKAMKDQHGTGRGYDKNNRPNDHRPSSINFPSQAGPTNPVARNQNLTKMWNDSLLAQTKRSQKLQRPGE